MQLNEREASLVGAFRRLPPDTASELSALAERLAELAPNQRIDWSDSWSDEDLNDFRAASLRRLEAEESEGPDCSLAMWWSAPRKPRSARPWSSPAPRISPSVRMR